MLLFVMPYHNDQELEFFQFIIDHLTDFVEINIPFEFLFIHSIDKRIRTDFEHTFFAHRDDPAMKKWQHIAAEWFDVANHISENIDCKCWFWWEHDVLPVKKDCFDFFMSMWTESCQVMGYRVKDRKWGMKHKINGAAFYGKQYADYIRPFFSLEGTFDTRKAFNRKSEKGIFVELNRWYSLIHHEGPLLLTPAIRMVHGVKNRSLANQVLKGEKYYPVVSRIHRLIRNRLKVFYLNYISSKKYPPES
jgi:hypothetical protein